MDAQMTISIYLVTTSTLTAAVILIIFVRFVSVVIGNVEMVPSLMKRFLIGHEQYGHGSSTIVHESFGG